MSTSQTCRSVSSDRRAGPRGRAEKTRVTRQPGDGRRPGSPRDRRRAFTLIEVLVALTILAIAAVVLGAAYANTLAAHSAVAQRASGGSAMDFLHEQILNEPEREKVEKGGDLSLPDDRRLRWEAKIEEAAVPDLFYVTVTTRIAGGTMKSEEQATQSFMVLRPTWSDAQRREQLRSDWRASREKLQEARK